MKLKELTEENKLQKVPEILVLIGLPGVGKSTFIRKNFPNHVVVSSDDLIEKYAEASGKTYDEVFNEYIGVASRRMKQVAEDAFNDNKDVVWDQTNLTKKKRRSILNGVPEHYRKIAVVFDIPDKLRYERAAGRMGKTIPPHIVKSMERSYQAPTKDEGFDKIITVKE